MGTEVLVGLIGLGGAVIGAAAAFAGVVYQQKHQTRREDEQRRIALSEGAVDALIAQLESLREHAWKRPADEAGPAWREWMQGMIDALQPMRLSMLRLTDAHLRGMLEAAWLFEFGHSEVLQEVIGLRSGKLLMTAMTAEAQECLGHHLRGEPLPKTRFLTAAVRKRSEILSSRP